MDEAISIIRIAPLAPPPTLAVHNPALSLPLPQEGTTMADWAAAAAAWAKSGEGEKNELAPPPPPPPQSFEQQQQQQQSATAWGGTEQQQQQMWMDPALAGHDAQHQQHGGFAPGPAGVDPMAGGGHQGFAHGGTDSKGFLCVYVCVFGLCVVDT